METKKIKISKESTMAKILLVLREICLPQFEYLDEVVLSEGLVSYKQEYEIIEGDYTIFFDVVYVKSFYIEESDYFNPSNETLLKEDVDILDVSISFENDTDYCHVQVDDEGIIKVIRDKFLLESI